MSALDCTSIREKVKGFSLVHSCDTVRNGWIRFSTPFLYPDGSNIDIFLKPHGVVQGFMLSDQGQTVSHLFDLHIYPHKNKKKKQIVKNICDLLGVINDDGELTVPIIKEESDVLIDGITRLIQACIRVSDLSLSQRFPVPSSFKEDVDDFIDSLDIEYEQDFSLITPYGNPTTFDFLTKPGPNKTPSLILTMSTFNSASASSISNGVFIKWWDVREKTDSYKFLTVYNSENDIFKEVDLHRMEEVSTIVSYPAESSKFAEMLLA